MQKEKTKQHAKPLNMKTRDELISISELAYCSGTSQVIIRQMVQEELIEPALQDPEPCFETSIRDHVCKIMRLHAQLGVGFESMEIVLNLLDRIEQLEAK